MRLGDCCTLEWSAVDLDSKSPAVVVKTSKTGETVCIPIFEHLRSELDAARNRNNGNEKYVWPEQAKLYLRQHSLVSRKLRKVFSAAVGEDALYEEREQGKLKASVIDFPSLRTTWITETLSRGVPIETVKLVSGHKTVEVVTKHYFHPNRLHVQNALAGAHPLALTEGSKDTKAAEGAPADLLNQALKTLKGLTPKTARIGRLRPGS